MNESNENHAVEVAAGERFTFGKNWTRFLELLNDDRIQHAETSLKIMLGIDSLQGLSFLDVGSGSGLFSLAARRLGARVHSFDFDSDSVKCTAELKRRFFGGDPDWIVESGSILDSNYLAGLPQHDIVYSWGVLHHTGKMWTALNNVAPLVAPGGRLFVAIYNDQGGASKRWWRIKRTYNKLPDSLKAAFTLAVMAPRELVLLLVQLSKGTPLAYFRNVWNYSQTSQRGMSYWRDIVDWIGGFPFEVATPDQIFKFFHDRKFSLFNLKTVIGGSGCNEYVFILQPQSLHERGTAR